MQRIGRTCGISTMTKRGIVAKRKTTVKRLGGFSDLFGVNKVWIDKEGRLALECLFCDSIAVDMIGHLKTDHVSNPVAQRVVEEYTKAFDAS